MWLQRPVDHRHKDGRWQSDFRFRNNDKAFLKPHCRKGPLHRAGLQHPRLPFNGSLWTLCTIQWRHDAWFELSILSMVNQALNMKNYLNQSKNECLNGGEEMEIELGTWDEFWTRIILFVVMVVVIHLFDYMTGSFRQGTKKEK